MNSLYLRAIEFILALTLLSGAYFYVYHKGYEAKADEVAVAQAKADKAQQDRYNLVAEKYETLKNTRNENARTIIKQVEKIVDRPVYIDHDCIDTDGLSIANSAIQRTNSVKPSAKVPAN
jgi:hypothetical protein